MFVLLDGTGEYSPTFHQGCDEGVILVIFSL